MVDAVRTPISRSGGALTGVRPDDLGAIVRALLDRNATLDRAALDEVPRPEEQFLEGALGPAAHLAS